MLAPDSCSVSGGRPVVSVCEVQGVLQLGVEEKESQAL